MYILLNSLSEKKIIKTLSSAKSTAFPRPYRPNFLVVQCTVQTLVRVCHPRKKVFQKEITNKIHASALQFPMPRLL